MKKTGFGLLTVSLFLLGVISCQTARISQDTIFKFIDDYEKKAEYINRRVSQCLWDYYTEENSDSLDYYLGLQEHLLADPIFLGKLREYQSRLTDKDYLQKIDRIYRRSLRPVIDSRPEIRQLSDSLESIYDQYQITFAGNQVSASRILNVLHKDNNRSRRQDACRAIYASGSVIADGLKRLAGLRNQTTVRLGYNSYFDLMLTADGIGRTEFNEFINEMDQLTAGPYRQLLDSLSGLLEIDDIRIWDIDFALGIDTAYYDRFFPRENQLDLSKETLRGMGVNIDGWPIYLTETQKEQDIFLPVHVPEDVRLIISPEPGNQSFEELLGLLGRAVYSVHMDRTDYLYSNPPAPCFGLAMATAITGMTERKSWMRRYAGVPEPDVIRIFAARAARNLVELRLALVHLGFERELYNNPHADLNQKYNSLFGQYMFFPPDLEPDAWAADIGYVREPVALQNMLIARCIVEQTYSYLEEKYGGVVDNTHTREFLVQNYYRFGGGTDWRVLVSRGTGEDLDPKFLLNYCSN